MFYEAGSGLLLSLQLPPDHLNSPLQLLRMLLQLAVELEVRGDDLIVGRYLL